MDLYPSQVPTFFKYFYVYFGVSATFGLKEGSGQCRASAIVLYDSGQTTPAWHEEHMLLVSGTEQIIKVIKVIV